MAKPWPQITNMSEAVEYVGAELAEAQAKCPSSVPGYQKAYATASAALLMDFGTMKSTLEAELAEARAVWHANCSTTEPATITQEKVEIDANGGVVPSGTGSSAWIWIGVAAAIGFLLWGGRKKIKRGFRKAQVWRKTRTVGYVRANPCHGRRRR